MVILPLVEVLFDRESVLERLRRGRIPVQDIRLDRLQAALYLLPLFTTFKSDGGNRFIVA